MENAKPTLENDPPFPKGECGLYYINLDHRTDRLAQIESELDKMGWREASQRIPGVLHPIRGVGCGMAHIHALEKAMESGYESVLILEDDFEFTQTKETVHAAMESIRHLQYDVVMLAANLHSYWETTDPRFQRVYKATTASGYLVSRNAMPLLKQNMEDNMELLKVTQLGEIFEIDQGWSRLQQTGTWYCLHPKLGRQRESYSDHCKEVVWLNGI